MTISIFLARSAGHLDQAYRVRYDVFVEEEQRFPKNHERRIYDRFDCFPGTGCVVAIDRTRDEDRAVGTVRFATRGELGLPSDEYYDFSDVTAGLEGVVASMGMLAVCRKYRYSRGLLPGIVKIAWRELRRRGARHVVAPVSPESEVLLRAMGARQVGDRFEYGDPPVTMTPLWLDMDNINPVYREMSVDPQNILFDEIHERRLSRHGTRIIREGETGDEAFMVMKGTVRAYSGDRDQPNVFYLLGPGEIFGEIALLDAGPHRV